MKARNVLSIFYKTLLLLIAAIFLINLSMITQKIILENDLPKFFGFSQVIVLSGSMEPVLNVGDFLVIREYENYQVNDIVTVRCKDTLVTHRIIEIKNGYVTTKGDANNIADQSLPMDQIEGKVILCIPWLGKTILYLKTPPGILLLAIFGCLLLAASYITNKDN